MKRTPRKLPTSLARVWMAVASLSLGSLQAAEIGEVLIATGYRQDSSSFGICSTLASPDHYGFGKLRSRNMHIWEIGASASVQLSNRSYLRSAISYGVILGGRVSDSGVADINSNPLNAVLGEYYTGCCGCDCRDLRCVCDCPGKTFHTNVEASATLHGNVVDFNIALGVPFRPQEDWMIAPVVGYFFNSQRQRWKDALFGPVQIEGYAWGCPESAWNPGGTPVFGQYTLTGSVDGTTVELLQPYFSAEDDGGYGAECIYFGHCFDGSVYRARWSGPFVGVDIAMQLNNCWNVVLSYALSYNFYDGKFESFTGSNGAGCYCDSCPGFLTGYGDVTSAPAFTKQSNGFRPSEMKFTSEGMGQELSLATDYRCGCWTAGIGIGYTYRQANHCAGSDPTESCELTRNPLTELVSGRALSPIWKNATLTKARWNSISALLTLAYHF